jgi:thymidine phosphorylase
VSAGAGVRWHKREGDAVAVGDLLFDLYTDEESRFAGAHEALVTAVTIGAEVVSTPSIVIDRITA